MSDAHYLFFRGVEMKHLKPLIALLVAGFVLCGVWLLLIAPASRTVDFSGTVESVRVDEENGSVYVIAVQDASNFTCEIEIKKHTRCKDADGAKVDPSELQAGDMILLNFRGKVKQVDGINKAVTKSTVKVYRPSAAVVAKIGDYTITESTLKEYMLLLSVQNNSENSIQSSAQNISTAELAAQMYAKAQIAAEEISDTSYAVDENDKTELLKSEQANFDRDYEANTEFCEQLGITHEELINAVATSRWNSTVEGRHLSMIIENYKTSNPEKKYSAEELLEVYENYMGTKVSTLKFVVLNNEKIQQINSSISDNK